MFRGELLIPVSEVLARVLVQAAQTILAAKDVLIEKESFHELSSYLEKIRPILAELADKTVKDTPPMMLALESLEREMKSAKELINTCSSRSRIYLLVNCRSIVKQIQEITREMGRCLTLLPMATLDVSASVRDLTARLSADMQRAQFKAAVAQEEIVDKIESGIRDRQTNSDYANELLLQIAKAVGVNDNPASLMEELQKFRKEKEDAQNRKKLAEAMQLEQIVALLGRADVATTTSEKRVTYESRRLPGVQPLPALQSFYCPITREVMEDPVEVASGQTFERSAIEQWFAAGNNVCPTTNVELESLEMKPNLALRQSIEEWRERNTAISISATGPKLRSQKEEDVVNALIELHRLSEEKGLHRYWIAAEGLIPVLVGKLRSTQRNIRKLTLTALRSLAVNNNENKEAIEDAGAVPLAVRSLARDVGEGREAVGLLLELSKHQRVCDQIGKVQGCILLLVTMLNSENSPAVENARELLDKLSHNDQNVVQMAEANHFRPLALRLTEGSDMTKVLMASALSRMVLTEQSKAVLVSEGAIVPLVKMITSGKLEAKSAALGALQNLSTLPENREFMISAGVIPPLLRLLFSVTSVVMSLKEQAAATLANLSSASTSQTQIDAYGNVLESDETINQLLSLLNLAGPDIQCHLLRALRGMSCHPSAIEVRAKMREGGAIQLLLPFCDVNELEVRVNAVQLLSCLSGDGAGKELGEQMGQPYIQALVKLIQHSKREEEKAAALGILGNLPLTDSLLTEWLMEAEVLPAIVQLLALKTAKTSSRAARSSLLENAVGALLRFTLPSEPRLQQLVAEADAVPLLVQLLSVGTSLAKYRSATALGQLSQTSWKLSIPVTTKRRFSCFAPPVEPGCEVHGGYCSVRTSFCLVAAEAVSPLAQVLEERSERADEAALIALGTLLSDNPVSLERGVQALVDANAVIYIVRILSGGSIEAKEKAVGILEKIFRIDRFRNHYGQSAQLPLIDLTQKGSNVTRSLAAQTLAHLNVLHPQSSYF